MTRAVQEALSTRARCTRFDLPDADHMVGPWLHDHPEDRREFVKTLL
ncbi:hypothetical protein [Streptomyces olivaceoviridis]